MKAHPVEDWMIGHVARQERLRRLQGHQQRAQQVYEAWLQRRDKWLAKSAPRSQKLSGAFEDTLGGAREAAEKLFK